MPFAFQILSLNSSTILWYSSINIILLILKIIKINEIKRCHIWTPASESPSSWLPQMCLVWGWILESAISSVAQSYLTLRPHESQHARPPCHHQLPESTQTHVHQVGDAIQPSHPLLSPSLPAAIPSQHQGLFQWVNSSHEVAKVLEFQLQHQSFQWTPRTDLL